MGWIDFYFYFGIFLYNSILYQLVLHVQTYILLHLLSNP